MPPSGRDKESTKLDQLMDRASRHLVAGRYFDAEQECAEALAKALAAADYERMARILLPLQEARRQKRDLAFDAAEVYVVDGALPSSQQLKPGCYLVSPPRVGVDGRMLREEADRRQVPVIITVREPTTRDGLWPIVTVGPVTVRTRVRPPQSPAAKVSKASRGKTAAAGRDTLPDRTWFLAANESLGDFAIAEVGRTAPAESRVQALYDRLGALPDHEKLHQTLAEACREAARARNEQGAGRVRQAGPDEDEEGD
ncbi:MAG: hypothetical protein KF745_15345 [Phycisphaeraceae bacterium]|nr:hypothetical protein [Phycisphaeraceae bacterium]